ncbi:MAG: electron transfer flavoprotein subunit alpha, partial [Chloroflexi bacterium]|nr:electron transfer flavoprotein subunit alpha [Chloroflexota bacterium]
LGVRGNLNHMIGVQRAGKIVAVNLDPDADIMKVCDLGIEGDVLKIVPLLTAELRTRKQKRSGE